MIADMIIDAVADFEERTNTRPSRIRLGPRLHASLTSELEKLFGNPFVEEEQEIETDRLFGLTIQKDEEVSGFIVTNT